MDMAVLGISLRPRVFLQPLAEDVALAVRPGPPKVIEVTRFADVVGKLQRGEHSMYACGL